MMSARSSAAIKIVRAFINPHHYALALRTLPPDRHNQQKHDGYQEQDGHDIPIGHAAVKRCIGAVR